MVTSPYNLEKNQVFRLRNLLLAQHTALITRPGYSVVSTSPEGANPVILRGYLNPSVPANTSYQYAMINNVGAGETRLYRTDSFPWPLVGVLPDANGNAVIPQAATMLDAEVFAMGNFVTPSVYDGTTITPITAGVGQTRPPGAAHAIYHLGALWLWNTSPATTTLDGPSSLRQSDINDYNSWPSAFQTFVGKNDGQTGQGMATFTIAETGISPTQTLVLFKDFSTYQVTGTFGASNFAVQRIKSDMGCIAPRTIQFLSGYGIVRLTHKGFAIFNGVDDIIISEKIRPLIFGDPTGIYGSPGVALDFSTVVGSYGSQSFEPLLYIAACPVIGSGGQLARFFVYDLVRKAWTVCDFPINFSWMGTLYRAGMQPTVQGASYQNPVALDTIFGIDQTDDGAAVNWTVTTKVFSIGPNMDNNYYRRGEIHIASSLSKVLTVETVYNNNAVTQTNVINVTIIPGREDTRVSYNMMTVAPAITSIKITGSGVVSLRGITVQGVQRHLTAVLR